MDEKMQKGAKQFVVPNVAAALAEFATWRIHPLVNSLKGELNYNPLKGEFSRGVSV